MKVAENRAVAVVPLRVRANWPIVVLLLVLPAAALALWHWHNARLPSDDAADFASTGYEIFARFRDQGVGAGLSAVYDVRGWRPTVFPVLLLPALLIFFGDVAHAVGLTMTLLYLGLTLYLYRLARLYVGPTRSALVANCVVSVPTLLQWAVVFFSEIAWLLFSIAFVFHLLRAQEAPAAKDKYCAAAALGLMLITRPVETAVVLAVPLIWLAARALRDHSLDRRDAIWGAVAGAGAAAVLGLSLFVPLPRAVILISAFIPIGSACFFLRRRTLASLSPLAVVAIVSSGIAVLWWAGFVPQLYDWAYEGSFGEMARLLDRRSVDVAVVIVALSLFSHYGSVQFAVLGLTAAANVLLHVLRSDPLRMKGTAASAAASARPTTLLVIGAGMLVPTLGLLVLTGTGEPRRVMPAMTVLLVGLAVLAVRDVGTRNWVGCTPVALLTLAQLWLLVASPGLVRLPTPEVLRELGVGLAPPSPAPEWNLTLIDELQRRELPRGSLIAVYTQGLFNTSARLYEPAALKVASLMRGSPFSFGYVWQDVAPDAMIERLRSGGYRLLLLDTFDDPGLRSRGIPYVSLAGTLLDMSARGERAPFGLRPVARFTVGGRDQLLFSFDDLAPSTSVKASASPNGPVAVATNSQTGFPVSNINDGTPAAWGSTENPIDVYAGIDFHTPRPARELEIRLFTPNGRAHLRDVRVVFADDEQNGRPRWQIARSRLSTSEVFTEKVTIPLLPDSTVVRIQVDLGDSGGKPHRFWGVACLSASKGDGRNYLSAGRGVYFRELQVK